jgi:hypothetical protein
MNSLIRTVQGCDGYIMDLAECADHYGVTPDALKRFVADGRAPTWLIISRYDDPDEEDGLGEEFIACDGD